MTILENIEILIKKLHTRKSKNIIYLILVALVVGAFAYRFSVIAKEGNTEVFNIIRNDLANGTPIETLKMNQTDGILYQPITIKNNRAYVSGARVDLFKSGQKIGGCKIVSVSQKLDLDTGMYVIKTDKCDDGLQYAENKKYGFYVPTSAVYGNVVYIADNGFARARQIEIAGRDANNVLIVSGINDGDVIILSHVKDNQKIQIVK